MSGLLWHLEEELCLEGCVGKQAAWSSLPGKLRAVFWLPVGGRGGASAAPTHEVVPGGSLKQAPAGTR